MNPLKFNDLKATGKSTFAATSLALCLICSPLFVTPANAAGWLGTLLKDILIGIVVEVIVDPPDNNERPSQEKQIAPKSDLNRVKTQLRKGNVVFQGDDGRVDGKVVRTWTQDRKLGYGPGIAARFNWEDGLESTMLLMENQTVSTWFKGRESTGVWAINQDGSLEVKMAKGSRYHF